MDTPNILKGFFYPSSRIQRCPRFHPCKVCKKCQNFDAHQPDCRLCEMRVRPNTLCDHLPDGRDVDDVQLLVKKAEEFKNRMLAHPDAEGQNFEDVSQQSQKDREDQIKAARLLKKTNARFIEEAAMFELDEDTKRSLRNHKIL